MNQPDVRTAMEGDRERALYTMTLAFAADPLMRWIMPSAQNYLATFGDLTTHYGGPSIGLNTCFVTDGVEGAAMWLPPGVSPDEEAMGALMMANLAPEKPAGVFELLAKMTSYHPHDEDCWYLAMIGVDPGHQKKGMGAALMKHATAMLDENGWLGYLESSNPMNISLYQRHGFEIMDEIQVGDSPVVTPMIRPRRT
ncbi:MAG: GNAT family N-acetyltransferase [Pseudomonadota bacterium]